MDQCNSTLSQLQSKSQSSSSSDASSSSAFSQAHAALQEKILLSQQNSVFSTTSEGTRSDQPSQIYSNLVSADGTELYCHCSTRDSGYYGGSSVRTTASQSSQECSFSATNYYLQMENMQDFALQIAQGLQHLESLNVSFGSCHKLIL